MTHGTFSCAQICELEPSGLFLYSTTGVHHCETGSIVGNTIPELNHPQNQTEHGIPLPETLGLIPACSKQTDRPKKRQHGKAFL